MMHHIHLENATANQLEWWKISIQVNQKMNHQLNLPNTKFKKEIIKQNLMGYKNDDKKQEY